MQSHLDQALAHHRAGRLEEAEAMYRQILHTQPDHADALHLLGVIALQSGQPDTAMRLIQQAIEHKPNAPEYHLNLGSASQALGRLEDAVAAFRHALTLRPDYADAYNNIGLALQAQTQFVDAVSAFQHALELQPEDPELHSNLGVALIHQGRISEAITAFKHALTLDPNYLGALTNLGTALEKAGKLTEAIASHRRALALDPNCAQAHYNLGVALEAMGELEKAAQAYGKALRLVPDNVETIKALVAVLRLSDPEVYRPELEENIKTCLASPVINPQDLARVTARLLLRKHNVTARLVKESHALISDLARDELVVTFLTRTVNVEAAMEAALVTIRGLLLLEHQRGEDIAEAIWTLLVALALQCFGNEYLLRADAQEEEIIEKVADTCAGLAGALLAPDRKLEQKLLLIALYRPLHTQEFAPKLGALSIDSWSERLRPLIQRALKEPLEEARIASTIESLGEMEDLTSEAVRAQYEDNPYPRWLELARARGVDMQTFLRNQFPHFTPPAFLNGPAKVLVAGCGTGQEPLAIAQENRGMEIVAIDFSRRSLAYAARMARKLDLTNVRFVHGDILALSGLSERFHVIECAGVLHHMAEPMRGWRVLSELLAPGGLMQVSLYSARAREPIVTARARIRALGLTAHPSDIRAFRQRILEGGEPALAELAASEDLYSLSACRDLLFHTQEHRFTLPDVSAALDELGLTFIGFELPSVQLRHAYRMFRPEDVNMTDLSGWNAFEQGHPRTFWGMYVFWCQKE